MAGKGLRSVENLFEAMSDPQKSMAQLESLYRDLPAAMNRELTQTRRLTLNQAKKTKLYHSMSRDKRVQVDSELEQISRRIHTTRRDVGTEGQ